MKAPALRIQSRCLTHRVLVTATQSLRRVSSKLRSGMHLDDDYSPTRPDLALVCHGGETVHARAFLLMLASDPSGPLMPAIRTALNEHYHGQTNSKQLVAAGPSADADAASAGLSTAAAGSPADTSGLAVLKVEEDSAEAWQQLLLLLDYPQSLLAKPEVTWANVEPIMLLAHKYQLRAPVQLAAQFLASQYTVSTYARLSSTNLARMPSFLALARRLGLTGLHNSIMACLADNLGKLSHKARGNASLPLACQACGASFASQVIPLATLVKFVKCEACGKTNGLPAFVATATWPTNTVVFSRIWEVPETVGNRVEQCMSQQQVLQALQSQLAPEDAVQLLATLVGLPSKSSDDGDA